ncbi:5'/3'-nucleotidase SurE, partial [Microcoleus sp. K4-C2]
ARQGIRRYFDIFQKRTDPRGKTYYWLAGELLEDIEEIPDSAVSHDIPTDVQAIRDNRITVTPLQYNLTCTPDLHSLRDWQFEGFPKQ